MPHPIWNIPNGLSFVRVPLAVGIFLGIEQSAWLTCLILLVLALLSDAVDGWWARRYGPLTALGRNLDPLTDKVLVCGCFVYLVGLPSAQIAPWMATLIVSRELLVTGLRGVVEASGQPFGADWFGKLKMILQSVVLCGVFLLECLNEWGYAEIYQRLMAAQIVLKYLMLASVVGSLVQYLVKAGRRLTS